jgi:hypothetical protein
MIWRGSTTGGKIDDSLNFLNYTRFRFIDWANKHPRVGKVEIDVSYYYFNHNYYYA